MATLSGTTPTSISASGNVYTLGIGLSGTPTGVETLTVNPASNSIYDAYSNISTISQSNNAGTINDKTPPTITLALPTVMGTHYLVAQLPMMLA